MEIKYIRDRNLGKDVYYACETFNGCKYSIFFSVDSTFKSEKIWIAASSGKKRKDTFIFEQKDNKSLGGMKALFWMKKALLGFPEWFGNPLNKQQYIVIGWADSRRRDIYERLTKEGFLFAIQDGSKVLMKKL